MDGHVTVAAGSPGAGPGKHELINPPELAAPVGFTHAVVAAPGRLVQLAGQLGGTREQAVVPGGLVAQFDRALGNLVLALRAAGGAPEDLVAVQIYVTDLRDYRSRLGELGLVWRRHLGRHYPAAALLGVRELFEPDALVEITGSAVVPSALGTG